MKIKGGVYKISNIINDKVYIGSSKNVHTRLRTHRRELKNNVHHSRYLQRAFNKYGAANFLFEVIEYIKDENNLIPREQDYIDLFLSYIEDKGYNMEPIAGSSKGVKRSDEFKAKLRAANLGKIRPISTVESNRVAQTGLHVGEKNSASRTFIFKSPDGVEHTVKGGFYKFCKEHNLGKNNMIALHKGKRKEFKGWTLIYASAPKYIRKKNQPCSIST